MNRKDFLKNISLLTAGAAVLPHIEMAGAVQSSYYVKVGAPVLTCSWLNVNNQLVRTVGSAFTYRVSSLEDFFSSYKKSHLIFLYDYVTGTDFNYVRAYLLDKKSIQGLTLVMEDEWQKINF